MPQALKDWIEVAAKAVQILGILAAGAWAYFNYFRGRTYMSRLQLKADGQLLHRGKDRYILVSLGISNRGLSNVPIDQTGTALRVLVHSEAPEDFATEHLETIPIFTGHHWIEPNEAIEDEALVRIPQGDWLGIRLEFRLVSQGKSWEVTRTCPVDLKRSADS